MCVCVFCTQREDEEEEGGMKLFGRKKQEDLTEYQQLCKDHSEYRSSCKALEKEFSDWEKVSFLFSPLLFLLPSYIGLFLYSVFWHCSKRANLHAQSCKRQRRLRAYRVCESNRGNYGASLFVCFCSSFWTRGWFFSILGVLTTEQLEAQDAKLKVWYHFFCCFLCVCVSSQKNTPSPKLKPGSNYSLLLFRKIPKCAKRLMSAIRRKK